MDFNNIVDTPNKRSKYWHISAFITFPRGCSGPYYGRYSKDRIKYYLGGS